VSFALDVAPLFAAVSDDRQYEDLTTFPALYEDIALALSDDVPAARVRELVLDAGGELLRAARVFDVYRGEQVGEGRKSLALRLSFMAPDRTLTDEEDAGLRERIRAKVEEIGGALGE